MKRKRFNDTGAGSETGEGGSDDRRHTNPPSCTTSSKYFNQHPNAVCRPGTFFRQLAWIDGKPLPHVIEPYRMDILNQVLWNFDEDGRPVYSMALCGRAKKCFKTTDLVLAAFYRFFAWKSPQGNDAFVVANDKEQASQDLTLAKKLIAANPLLAREVDVYNDEIRKRDGTGTLKILPTRDVAGAHGRTYLFLGFDEIHAYKNWDLIEALSPDPTRHDALTWITSYASIFNSPGKPLHDLFTKGKHNLDPRMFLSWYSADYGTDPNFNTLDTPEERANPSMVAWGNDTYLAEQKNRLPMHKYRRLHLNMAGSPEGAAFDGQAVQDSVVEGRKRLMFRPGHAYVAFVDMSGGSIDDASLAIAHDEDGTRILDLCIDQERTVPFSPRAAVMKFANLLKQYGLTKVHGDSYGGLTFRLDFQEHGIEYEVCSQSKSNLFDHLEPLLNARSVELLDVPKLQEQLLTLVRKGDRVSHQQGDHDDVANAAAGAVAMLGTGAPIQMWGLNDSPGERTFIKPTEEELLSVGWGSSPTMLSTFEGDNSGLFGPFSRR
jgi:phage terminase large subunit-like protein